MITERRSIIQFTHPGGEHNPDRGKDYKSWNEGKHKRKFMLAKGDFVENEKKFKDELLLFWGEWEPDSKVFKRLNKTTDDFPKYIYCPLIPNLQNEREGLNQNTDPFIFSEEFYYFCCKQTKRNGEITQMARLANGSIILFGSTINQDKENAYFALDTAFVVRDHIDYSSSNIQEIKEIVSEDFFNFSFNSIKHITDNRRCYFGANYENRFDGMYSFVPCKKFEDQNTGFERVKLTNKDFDFITNNLNSAPKLNKEMSCTFNYYEIWNKLRVIIKNQGFIEGVKFSVTL